jgi:hypothetical protein
MTSMFLAMIVVAAGPTDSRAMASFTITSPAQTARSVLLAWETDEKVRTLKASQRWNASTPTGPTHRASVARAEGRLGTACAKIEGQTASGNARACWMQERTDTRPGPCQYRLFYRTAGQDPRGRARLVIDCYLGDARKYHGLISKDLPPAETWNEVTGSFTLPPDARHVRILLYQVGVGTAWFDDVRWSPAGSDTNLLADGSFDGTSSFRVFYRQAGETAWQAVDAVVLERFHNVIFLEPETTYQFKVQRITATRQAEAESRVLTIATRRDAERVWEGLRWGPDARTPTPPAVYPCIKSLGGKLYYAESRGGSIWLSELDNAFKARWTKEWVKPYLVDGHPCYQGQSQPTVRAGKLYISWKRAFHGDAPHARQCVASYDPVSGAIGKPLVIEPDRPGDSTWNGGIAAIGDQLWVSYCLWHPEGERYKTIVTVRRLDYESGKLGPAFTLSPQPTETPYTPFLSVFKGELAVCFTESQAKTDQQPLYLVRFDGKRFHDLMTVSPRGFNQYAKGVQYGDKLLLLWKYGAPYPSPIYGRYMFHDIGMALVDPVAKSVKLTSLIDDLKYDSSPDITEHEGGFIYVYNKFEHLYGERNDPTKQYGCFIGRITPSKAD